jgi:hypothetical protein
MGRSTPSISALTHDHSAIKVELAGLSVMEAAHAAAQDALGRVKVVLQRRWRTKCAASAWRRTSIIASACRPGPRRSVVWSHLWDPATRGAGRELVWLSPGRAQSNILVVEAARQYRVQYEMTWDVAESGAWIIREAHIKVEHARGGAAICLSHDGAGNWCSDAGRPEPEFEGCLDLDLWPTPFTNTFPIRRLDAPVGQPRAIEVVYIEAPELTIARKRQRYTRTTETAWRFESLEDAFTAEIQVDDDSLVSHYDGLFERLTSPS